ncbi:MAG: hypothetical protein AAF492_13735, partial [Verrucomicrobiota bacterium]
MLWIYQGARLFIFHGGDLKAVSLIALGVFVTAIGIWVGSGRKKTVLYLRKFGHYETIGPVVESIRKGHVYKHRFIALDGNDVSPIPANRSSLKLSALLILLALGLAAWTTIDIRRTEAEFARKMSDHEARPALTAEERISKAIYSRTAPTLHRLTTSFNKALLAPLSFLGVFGALLFLAYSLT